MSAVLAHLERLVAFDTRNPPRAITPDDGLFAYVRGALPPGFTVEVVDSGQGCVSLLAVRGRPTTLVNVHVDTVPADAAWVGDPHRLVVDGPWATGLGACDIKGAAAAMLAAASATVGDAALLFSSDEEAGSSVCVRAFTATHCRPEGARFPDVVVCEPTSCRAVVAHRGIATGTIAFTGTAGHASQARALDDSAVHALVRWAAAVIERAASSERGDADASGLRGLRLNVGAVEGGVKANMIASQAQARFGVRPPPSVDPAAVLDELAALAAPGRATLTRGFLAPPLPSSTPGGTWSAPGSSASSSAEARIDRARALAERVGLEVGPAVDFWTEAALFSQAGMNALVYGPGDIKVAHAPGERVLVDELHSAEAFFTRLFTAGGDR